MPLMDMLLGDSALLRAQEAELVKQEDRVFRMVENEDADLGVHVRADLPRFDALNARQRFAQTSQARRADRNFLLTLGGFVVLFAHQLGMLGALFKFVASTLSSL